MPDKDWMLSDRNIHDAVLSYAVGAQGKGNIVAERRAIALAAKEQIVAWLEGPCECRPRLVPLPRRRCPTCWAEFRRRGLAN